MPFPLNLKLITYNLFLPLAAAGQYNVSVAVEQLPPYHPQQAELFLAGSFNGWNPADTAYRFRRNGHSYQLNISLPPGEYACKITRGSWEKTECQTDGTDIQNRVFRLRHDTTINWKVDCWTDRFPKAPRKSTASPQVQVLDTAFLIPQLNRTRRVWIYLPKNYASGQQRYPVVYLQDGQNVFDDATSFSGEWGVDEYLDSTGTPCIVVAIDHGGQQRLKEYSPFNFDSISGEGKKYAAFLAKTLVPYIDKKFRTLADAKHRFVGGSSMGGLISFYTALMYPGTFGGAAVLSPAFWTARPLETTVKEKAKNFKGKMFAYAGGKESPRMVPDMQTVLGVMKEKSKGRYLIDVDPEGRHNEAAWREVFPKALEWLLQP
ncbi:alpha/beta hydrolase [Nostoc ellipsosporum NOK]|nr:alpha/beta hydrolase [Nostoc ellipsosporum NOK]